MFSIDEIGARAARNDAGVWILSFGMYLPGIRYDHGYRLSLRVFMKRINSFGTLSRSASG